MELIGKIIVAKATGTSFIVRKIDSKRIYVEANSVIGIDIDKALNLFILDDETRNQIEDAKNKKARSSGGHTVIRRSAGTENIAFKITYCDGGETDTNYGFRGVCSDKCRERNQKLGRAWCNFKDCPCAKLATGEITKAEFDEITKDFACYETSVFHTWREYAGFDNTKNPPRPRVFKKLNPNGIAVLTTETPDTKERFIIGLFKIGNYFLGDTDVEGYVEADADYRIEFTKEESKKLRFWDYYSNKNSDKEIWSQGLYRYMSDEQVLVLLKDVLAMRKGQDTESKIAALIDEIENKKQK